MKDSKCAHCAHCNEIKYDGFFCDMTGYVEDKRVEGDCHDFEADTIEPEQRHGKWKCIGEYEEFSEEMADYLCVNCGHVISRLKNQKPNFCENCGRDMRATDTNVGGKGGKRR